jgi:CBS domain-containing protein
MLTAKDIMNTKVIVITPDKTMAEGIKIMLDNRISGLPIVDCQGHVVGVITEYAMLAIAYDHEITRDPVGRHMTKDVIFVDVDDPMTKVADLFVLHRIRRVVVLQQSKVAGLISRRDLLREISTHRAAMKVKSSSAAESVESRLATMT